MEVIEVGSSGSTSLKCFIKFLPPGSIFGVMVLFDGVPAVCFVPVQSSKGKPVTAAKDSVNMLWA